MSTDYVSELEVDCRRLREQVRDLESAGDVARRFGRAPAPVPTNQEEVLSEVKDNALVRSHIHALNDLLGEL